MNMAVAQGFRQAMAPAIAMLACCIALAGASGAWAQAERDRSVGAAQSRGAAWATVVGDLQARLYPAPPPGAVEAAVLAVLTPSDSEAAARFAACVARGAGPGGERESGARGRETRRADMDAPLACAEAEANFDFERAMVQLLLRLSPYATYLDSAAMTKLTEDADITPAETVGPWLTSRMHDGVLAILLRRFDEDSARQIDAAIAGARDTDRGPGWRATVIDLRGNQGGLLDAVVAVADRFLPSGALFAIRGAGAGEIERFRSLDGDASGERPLILLIDGTSENGAEMLAAAMQDRRRALVMGQSSAGLTIIRTVRPLSRDTAFILPTAGVERSDGRMMDAPVEPDVVLNGDGGDWLAAAVVQASGLAQGRAQGRAQQRAN